MALASRHPDKPAPLCEQIGATAFACDVQDEAQVAQLFEAVTSHSGSPDAVIYNAGGRARGPLVTLDPGDVRRTLMIGTFGAFLVVQRAAAAMLPKGFGAILFTGASASVKRYAQSAPFAMGSSRCAALRKAWRASWPRRASMSRTS